MKGSMSSGSVLSPLELRQVCMVFFFQGPASLLPCSGVRQPISLVSVALGLINLSLSSLSLGLADLLNHAVFKRGAP